MDNVINIGIFLTYFMVGFAAFATLFFAAKRMIQNTSSAKKTLYTIGGLSIVLLLAYFLSSNEVLNSYEKYNISELDSKRVGVGLITFYFLILLAIASILYTELSKIFSK